MANYLATDTDLTAVANAIRTKGGTSAQLTFPQGFVDAIEAISGGGGGGTDCASGTVTVAEQSLTLSIDTGITPSYFFMVRANFNYSYPGYKTFNMVASNFARWITAGTNNSGTGGAVHTSTNGNTGKITLSGNVVTIQGSSGSGTSLGYLQSGDWIWVAWK